MSHGDFDGVREVDLGCLLLLETFERLVMMSQFTWCVSELLTARLISIDGQCTKNSGFPDSPLSEQLRRTHVERPCYGKRGDLVPLTTWHSL